MAAAVVAHGAADILRNVSQAADEIVDRLGGQVRMVGQRGVDVGDVGLVVLVVMELHGLGVDKRLERGVVIRKRGQFVGHFLKSPSFKIVLRGQGEALGRLGEAKRLNACALALRRGQLLGCREVGGGCGKTGNRG